MATLKSKTGTAAPIKPATVSNARKTAQNMQANETAQEEKVIDAVVVQVYAEVHDKSNGGQFVRAKCELKDEDGNDIINPKTGKCRTVLASRTLTKTTDDEGNPLPEGESADRENVEVGQAVKLYGHIAIDENGDRALFWDISTGGGVDDFDETLDFFDTL